MDMIRNILDVRQHFSINEYQKIPRCMQPTINGKNQLRKIKPKNNFSAGFKKFVH